MRSATCAEIIASDEVQRLGQSYDGEACQLSYSVHELLFPQQRTLTNWLMRMIAMLSRCVKSLKVSSTCLTVVSAGVADAPGSVAC